MQSNVRVLRNISGLIPKTDQILLVLFMQQNWIWEDLEMQYS